ncbi:MAG: EamA family transporter RarD [Spirochaetae bacterium HGW-Spirochaetae-9]|nr:MAG: EamA family transporter RarD [Spirochaetae bacterium HGW-Spirochaetae-9]
MEPDSGEQAKGMAFMVAVYLIWGVLPAYWKLLGGVPPFAVMAHRALWALVSLVIALVFVYKPKKLFAPLADKEVLVLHLLASLSLAVQWTAYLIAVSSGRLVELSMGYFLYPLVVSLLGWIFLKEKLNGAKIASLVLAGSGVAVAIAGHGKLPLLALVLAFSFSLYSLVKKRIKINSLNSIFYEILFLVPFALGYVAWSGAAGKGFFYGSDTGLILLLIGGGIITAITLLLFAAGAKRTPIFAIGFLQYISPTIVLLLGVFVYKESFGLLQWTSFALIWLGVFVYIGHKVRTRND